MSMNGQLTDAKSALTFMLAGKATVTFRSAKTGTHFTYKIQLGEKRQPNDPDTWFVKVLTGPDNSNSFTYMGMIRNGRFGLTRASKIGSDATSYKTFTWVFDNLQKGVMPELLEIWHEGRCGKCGKKLTVPESIATGFGPDCAKSIVDLPLIKASATPVIDQPHVKQPKQEQLPLEPMVTIDGMTMPLSQAEATAAALETLLADDLGNVPEL
jgi:hypothetical protein